MTSTSILVGACFGLFSALVWTIIELIHWRRRSKVFEDRAVIAERSRDIWMNNWSVMRDRVMACLKAEKAP